MAKDTFGNYIVGLDLIDVGTLPTSMGGNSSGVGPPDDGDGAADGNIYVNITTGDIYTKVGGTYVLFTGVPGGSGETSVGSPEGVITAAPGTTCYDTLNFAFYVKATGVGNTGWVPLIT